jgi:hypothetical protein
MLNTPPAASPDTTTSAPAADSAASLPDALKTLRNRHSVPEQPAASPLGMLHRARQRPASGDSDQQTEDSAGGESMNLEMKVAVQPDGALTVTTAGKSLPPDAPADEHRTNRQLAQEEENILLHRDADDPGYDENDQRYYDREPEL